MFGPRKNNNHKKVRRQKEPQTALLRRYRSPLPQVVATSQLAIADRGLIYEYWYQ